MRTSLFTIAAFSICLNSHAQYRKEAQQSQDTLVGKKNWISPPLPIEGSTIIYRETISTGNGTPADLFNNALEWYNYNYKTADTKLTIENPETGQIAGTGVIKYTPVAARVTGEVPIFFSFDLAIAEGQYTYKVYDLYGIDANGRFQYIDMYREDRSISTQVKKRWNKKYRYEMLSDMNTMTEMMINHLKEAMSRKNKITTR
jgi:hypothetical protein